MLTTNGQIHKIERGTDINEAARLKKDCRLYVSGGFD